MPKLTSAVSALAFYMTVNAAFAVGFLENPLYPTEDLPCSVAAADFNVDGRLDLVVVNYLSQSVSIYLGKGDGTLHA